MHISFSNRTSTSLDSTDDDESAHASPVAPFAAPPKPDKEKRKRSRVTPEQLVHLERFFLIDRSPTAARRRDISELLGMQERQTQIWFQNRRAKAKLQDTKQPPRDPDAPQDASPTPRYESAVHKLIHEDEPVSIIPCTDLTVGTWRRISSPGDVHDLVAYVCETKRCLNWFIHSGGYGFKMEIPFTTVTDTEYKMIGPHTGVASFLLSQPPVFYLEIIPPADDPARRTWKRCSDWTEGHQASKVLRHTVLGSDPELLYLLRVLHATPGTSSLGPRPPGFRTDPLAPSPMELQPPPLAGLGVVHPPYPDPADSSKDDYRKRASYGLPADEPRFATQPTSSAFSRASVFLPHPQTQQFDYTGQYSSSVQQPAPEPSSYPQLAGTAGLYARGYAPQAQQTYYDDARILQPFAADVDDMSPRITQPRGYSNASPTGFAKYHAEIQRDARQQQALHPGTSNSPLSGMPGMMYAASENNSYSC